MMKLFQKNAREILVSLAVAALSITAAAQTNSPGFPPPRYFNQLFHPPHAATQVPGTEGIQDYIAGGKLSLNLEQTVRLMLLNNTDLRINQLQFQQTRFAVLR